jgi:hypothetical protein
MWFWAMRNPQQHILRRRCLSNYVGPYFQVEIAEQVGEFGYS